MQINKMVRSNKIANAIARVIRSNESEECGYWKVTDNFIHWDNMEVNDSNHMIVWTERLKMLRAEGDNDVRLWWYTSQERPETRAEFYRYTGFGKIWPMLVRLGFVGEGYYDDGTFHSSMNLPKVIDFLEDATPDMDLDYHENELTSKIDVMQEQLSHIQDRRK